jgi:hypothetical protein
LSIRGWVTESLPLIYKPEETLHCCGINGIDDA